MKGGICLLRKNIDGDRSRSMDRREIQLTRPALYYDYIIHALQTGTPFVLEYLE